jgi:hypothetical protein
MREIGMVERLRNPVWRRGEQETCWVSHAVYKAAASVDLLLV